MHISTPPQVPGALLGNSMEAIGLNGPTGFHETADVKSGDIESSPGDRGHKTQEENQSGFFAKLLEGLAAKSKSGPKSEIQQNSEEGVSSRGKNAFSMALDRIVRKGAGKGTKSEGSDGELAEFVFPGQNSDSILAESSGARLTRKGLAMSRENSQRENSLGDTFLKSAHAGEDEKQGIKLQFNHPGRKTAESSELSNGKKAFLKETELPEQKIGRQLIARQLAGRQLADAASGERELRFTAGSRNPEKPVQMENQGASRSKKSRLNIDFRDQRTADAKEAVSNDASKGHAVFRSTEIEIPVDLKLSAARLDGEAAGKAGKEGSLNMTFEDALARELRGNLSADIVRDATVIARNGGEGIIRLSLRPASLGDVKIRLEMTENKITGLIIVESSEALRAFERELPVLEKAFKDSGFSETNLEMSLAQDEWNFAGQDQKNEEDFPVLAPVMAASRYEDGGEGPEPPDPPEIIQEEMIFMPERIPVNLLA